MATREVTHSRKDRFGRIVGLGKPSSIWSVRSSEDCIKDIQPRIHQYIVVWPEGTTEVHVAQGPRGPHLRTDRDGTTRNNLDDLPDI